MMSRQRRLPVRARIFLPNVTASDTQVVSGPTLTVGLVEGAAIFEARQERPMCIMTGTVGKASEYCKSDGKRMGRAGRAPPVRVVRKGGRIGREG